MRFKQRKWWQRLFSKILVIGMTGMMITPGHVVQAAAEPAEMAKIISQAGNAQMKALGQAYLGGQVLTTTTNDLNGKNVYYVDSVSGNDANDGTSEGTAWKTISRVNQKAYQPGDHILFKAGGTWTQETLSPKGSGTYGNPITIGSYGTGAKPKFIGNGLISELIYLENQEYWEIRDLDISNQAYGFTGTRNSTNGRKLKDIRGIRIAGGKGNGVLDGFYLHDLFIHDVTGEVAWIGGNSSGEEGIKFKTGWDGSKRTGGILFEILEPTSSDTPTTFNDILIEKNVLTNNSFAGISIKQWRGDFHTTPEKWASRDGGKKKPPKYQDTNWRPHTNVVIQDNYLDHSRSDYACNTIYLTSTKGATIQRNVSKGAGTSAIEMYYTDGVTVQNNEVFGTVAKCGGADSNAIDPDKETTNAQIQYNYIYETGDGILLCGFIYGSSVIRYNVIKDAKKRYINPHGDYGSNYIYNNILYNTRTSGTIDFIASSGGDKYLNKSKKKNYFYNNIFYNKATGTSTVNIRLGTSTDYKNNCYYGKAVKAPSQDTSPILADPQFIGTPGSNAEAGLSGLKLKPTSPLINTGKAIYDNPGTTITGNGGRDFEGNPLYNGNPDIGIFEYQGSADDMGTLIDETFNSYATGEFSSNGIWNIGNTNSANGKVTIEEDSHVSGNKYLKMEKTGRTDLCVYNKIPLAAHGIVTVEARMMRTDTPKTANQFGIYGFHKKSGDWNSSRPASSANPMATMAFTNGKIISHNIPGSSTPFTVGRYNENQWHVVRQVIHMDTNTFDIYLDDMNTAVAYNQPVRTNSSTTRSTIDFFNIFSSGSNIGNLYVDYFRVSIGAA